MAFIPEDERLRILALIAAKQGLRLPMPEPVQATPSSPLPGTPVEVPIVAPQAEAAVAPQGYDPLAAVRSAVQRSSAPISVGVKEIDAPLATRAAQQQAGAGGLLDVMAQAQEDPVAVAVREARLERARKEGANIEKEQKRAGWDALARAGLAMAQSNSPYFMQALASGMEAGLEGLDKAKLAADEKKSRLQAAEEDAKLAEVTGRQAAQDRAVAVYNAALSAGKSEAEARDAAIKSATTIAQLPQTMEMGNLEVRGKRAQVATDEEELKRLRQTPLGGFGRGGGGKGGDGSTEGGGGGKATKPLPPGARAELEGKLSTAYDEQDKAYAAWRSLGSPKKEGLSPKSAGWQAAQKYEAARGSVDRLRIALGQRPLGPAPTRRGSTSARPAANSGLPADIAKKYGL